jgi:hypothetical protein
MKYKKIFLILSVTIILASCTSSQYIINLRITDGITDKEIKFAVETNSSQLLSEMSKAFTEKRSPDFTGIAVSPEATETVLGIWNKISVINCNVSKLNRKCTKQCDGSYQVRDIPVILPNVASVGDTLHKIVINYTDAGTIDAIYLSADSVPAILTEESDDKEKCRRQQIIKFIDLYYTAYNVKDIDYISKVFKSYTSLVKGEDFPIEIDYKMLSQMEYLRKLKYVFAANKYINPEFKEIEIRQHPQCKELYGLIIKQSWNTSIYKDTGYVFFIISFEDKNDPKIEFSIWLSENHLKQSKDEIFNLYM